MVTIVTRASKGEALTHDEVDANFNNLNAHTDSTSNPHNTTKAQVGLGNVDNTSDANKPVSTAQQAALNLKANLAGAAFTGTVTVPDKVLGTNDGSAANTKFVQTAIAALVNSSPAALDTLNELATALGNDPNFATTMTNALSLKANAANAALTGTTSVAHLTFSGTGGRITGDFSNATLANRVMFQTTTANSNTGVSAIPNGTNNTSSFAAFNSSDPANASYLQFSVNTTETRISSSATGTATSLPMLFLIAGSEKARFDTSGNFGIGTSNTYGFRTAVSSGSSSNGLLLVGTGTGVYANFSDGTATNSPAIGGIGNSLVFATGSVSNTVKMTLDQSGNLLVGATAASGNKLIVNGSIRSFTQGNRNTLAFQIDNTNGAVAWLQPNLIGHWFTGSQDAVSLRVPSSSDATTGSYDIYQDGTHQWNKSDGTVAAQLDTSGNLGVSGSADPFSRSHGRMIGLTAASGNAAIEVNGAAGASGNLEMGAGGVRYGSVNASSTGVSITSNAAIPINFNINNAYVGCFDASGNLLVGVTSGSNHVIKKNKGAGYAGMLDISSDNGSVSLFAGGVDILVASTSNASAQWLGKHTSTSRSLSVTGTVNTGGTDYAEYMRKAANCGTVAKGAIVGVNAAGELTDKWADAVSFVVKSTDPSYVGGDTWGSEEALGLTRPTDAEAEDYTERLAEFEAALEEARSRVDRIAYAGQVPVNVFGANVGDYIVPVKDGADIKGIAVAEDDMTLKQYMKAVGIVQNILPDGRANIRVKVA